MLNRVEVRNDKGALLSLPLKDSSAGYLVKDISGLDPVKANIVSSNFAMLDGAYYQSSRRDTRNIVMKLGFSPDYATGSVRELRNSLYKFFMPKLELAFRFITPGAATVDILGTVESCETALFTKEPEVVVSIICFDPDFYESEPLVVYGSTVSDLTEIPVEYQGTTETGIIFKIFVDRALTAFTLYHNPPDGTLRALEFAASLVAGDVVEINTTPRHKGAKIVRSGVDGGSVLYGVSPLSNWISLLPGSNTIRVVAEGAAVPYTIEYTNKYGGL